MTQQLSELFNLASSDTESFSEEEIASIEENREMIAAVDLAIDKIDAALPFVNDLDTSDKELDDLSSLAQAKFQDLIDLGLNVEARFSGHILATAGTLLGHAITAKQAKIDRKLKTVQLQLQKAKLDHQINKDNNKSDSDKLLDAEDGQGVVLDRNALLAHILSSTTGNTGQST